MAYFWNIRNRSFKTTVEVNKLGDLFLAKAKKLITLGLRHSSPKEFESFGEFISGAMAEEEIILRSMSPDDEMYKKQKRRVSNLKKINEFYKTI